MEKRRTPMPKITVGRYAGTPIDQLPVSYLRWMLTQQFPKEWLEIAKKKVDASPMYNEYMSVSRHAIDRFSERFLHLWLKPFQKRETKDGIATFLVKLAERAWAEGTDVSKRRHRDDGIVKELEGVKYVFNVGREFPDYKDLITVMSSDEES
jgi:hypothetical protein